MSNLELSNFPDNIQKSFLDNDLNKGVYKDNAQNRKLGRVGRKYGGSGKKEEAKSSSSGDSHLPKFSQGRVPSDHARSFSGSKEEAIDYVSELAFAPGKSNYHSAKLLMENNNIKSSEVKDFLDKVSGDLDAEEAKEGQEILNEFLALVDKLPSQKENKKESDSAVQGDQKRKQEREKSLNETKSKIKFDKEKVTGQFSSLGQSSEETSNLTYSEPVNGGHAQISIWGGSTVSIKTGFKGEGSSGSYITESVNVQGVNKDNYFSKGMELAQKFLNSETGKSMSPSKAIAISSKLIENFKNYNKY